MHRAFFNNQEEAVRKWSVKASVGMGASSGPGCDCIDVSQAVRRKPEGVEYGTARELACNGSVQETPPLQGQATKCMWWMPWRSQAKKDAVACEKLRGAGKQALIRRSPNGETRPGWVIGG